MSTWRFLECRQAFEAIEASMGEASALLSEVANALSDHPDGLRIDVPEHALPGDAELLDDALVIAAEEWPSATDIQRLLSEWHETRSRVIREWTMLEPKEQAEVGPAIVAGRNLLHAVL